MPGGIVKINILSKVESFFNEILNSVVLPSKEEVQAASKKFFSYTTPLKLTNSKSEKIAKKKTQSQMDSQGISKFSGSSYNGKGRVDNSKIRSNKKRR